MHPPLPTLFSPTTVIFIAACFFLAAVAGLQRRRIALLRNEARAHWWAARTWKQRHDELMLRSRA